MVFFETFAFHKSLGVCEFKKKGAFRLIVPYNISNVFEMFENNENRGLKSMRQFNKKKI